MRAFSLIFYLDLTMTNIHHSKFRKDQNFFLRAHVCKCEHQKQYGKMEPNKGKVFSPLFYQILTLNYKYHS